jgi:hypothetical protein
MKRPAGLLTTAVAALVCTAACKSTYQNPNAHIDDRVADLLKRMSVGEKMAQLIQGDMSNYLDLTTEAFNSSGLRWNMEYRANSIWTGLYTNMTTVKKAAQIAQNYLVHNTSLGSSHYLSPHVIMPSVNADAPQVSRLSFKAKAFTGSSHSMLQFSTLPLQWAVRSIRG